MNNLPPKEDANSTLSIHSEKDVNKTKEEPESKGLNKQIKNLQKDLKAAHSVRVKVLKELSLGVRDKIITDTTQFIIKNAETDILEPAVRKKDLLEFLTKF
jgi:hypothetical protein